MKFHLLSRGGHPRLNGFRIMMKRPWRHRLRGSTTRRWLHIEPIYVEIRIRAPMEDLWSRTQTPHIHARWDLRFTDIVNMMKSDASQQQRFRYSTRFGPIAISGDGVTTGNREQLDRRTSALQFRSNDGKSLIERGSGYWQYIQTEDGVRFLTLYSYEPRWGPVGVCIDKLVFRRLLGWATAWSFDRLRLWIEKDLDPSIALRQSAIHAVARLALASIWLYQGYVPKLRYPETGEIDLVRSAGFSTGAAMRIVRLVGVAEIAMGTGTIALWHRREVFPISGTILTALALGALFRQPVSFRAPFNPASLTIASVSLAITGYLAACDLPSSRNCLRVMPRS